MEMKVSRSLHTALDELEPGSLDQTLTLIKIEENQAKTDILHLMYEDIMKEGRRFEVNEDVNLEFKRKFMKEEAVFDQKKTIAYKKEAEKSQKKYEAMRKKYEEIQKTLEEDTNVWTQLEAVPKDDSVQNETVK